MTVPPEYVRMAEALLFAAEEPLDQASIAAQLPDDADVAATMAALTKTYETRGVTVVRIGGKWSLRTAPDLKHLLERHVTLPRRLSRAAVETLAIIPFENETSRFEISQELHDTLLDQLPSVLGVRTGGEEFAQAVVRGRVTRYSVEAPIYRPNAAGDQASVLERQVMLTVNVEVVDLVNNVILWENPGLQARGEFLEAGQLEEEGRRLAITRLAQAIVDGLQSNW